MENFLDDDNQNQNRFSDLENLIVELSDAKYDDMSTPVPVVTKVEVSDTVSNNLVLICAEYEDNLIQEEYDFYG